LSVSKGAGAVIIVLSLETAIFWGQLSLCEKVDTAISRYSCGNRVSYRFMSMLAVIIFLMQIVLTALLAYFKDIVLKDSLEYEDISNYNADPQDDGPPPSADL
jgi:hypothetical protein